MNSIFEISSRPFDQTGIEEILDNNYSLALSDHSAGIIDACRKYLDERIKNSSTPLYGVTTGFGA
ncbi:MAG: histidine ammonia-lyase, partial [Bacteroidales bacterium]